MDDKTILRELAKQYKEIAQINIQQEKEKLYRRLNGLNPIRPVILIDEIPWTQLETLEELTLKCEGERERTLESFLRKELYKFRHFPCDMIVLDYIPWAKHIKTGSMGYKFNQNIVAFDGNNNVVSHSYKDQLDDEAIEKFQIPEVTVDEEADREDEEWLNDLLGDIIDVRMTGLQFVTYFSPWDTVAQLHGIENLMYDLIDEPEFMMKAARKLLEVNLGYLKKVEDMGLLDGTSPIIHSTAAYSDDLPGNLEDGKFTRRNVWGRGAAQTFVNVSPAMFEEFEMPLVKEYFKDFPRLYYGCCEPLETRIKYLREMPNLKKISVTPWADIDACADQIGSDYVMAAKANPSYLAVDTLDVDAIRGEIRHYLDAAKRNNTPLEITLKDISSVKYHPENIDAWAKIAMEMVEE